MFKLPRRRRDIINRRSVELALSSLDLELKPDERRRRALDIFKTALADGRAEIRRRFDGDGKGRGGANGPTTAHNYCYLIDQIVRVLHDDTADRVYPAPNPTTSERLTLVAVGGYGRGELAPFSDVDLLFLRPYKQNPRGEQVVEHMLYMLWDLGLKVGHATRSVDECVRIAKTDVTVATALLESRYIWGEQDLYAEFRRRFLGEVVSGTARSFVVAKLAERDERHARLGDSRYVLEPNLKEGKGGLRDLHTLYWIAKYAYRVESVEALVTKGVLSESEAAKFAKAQNFLWDVRCELHYIAGRPEERLTFDVQSELAAKLGYADRPGSRGVERFMKHYFLVAKDIGDLTRIFCAALESEQRKPKLTLSRLWNGWRRDRHGLLVDGDRLSVDKPDVFLADPVNLLRLFAVAQQHGLDIHPNALRLVTRNLRLINKSLREDPTANALFLEILSSPRDPEHTLRRMNEAGVFGRFVPDFGRVVAQMQYDMYHVYTVDEHTIFAVGIINKIERGELKEELPLATLLAPTLAQRRVLYVAVLLHDIAKGRGGDHSVLGARVAQRLGPRFGLSAEETETVAWLVKYHLLMSNTAFRRDLQDPKTIADFVQEVQSPERLKLLLILTVADIRAVGPKVWNAWKAALLRELYQAADDLMTGRLGADGVVAAAARIEGLALEVRDELKDWSDDDFVWFKALCPPSFWISSDAATLARQARLVRGASRENRPLAVETRVDPRRGITDITVLAHDQPGLFAQVAGAIAVSGATIVDARIFTLANGMALDGFSLQDTEGGAFDRPERRARLAVAIEQAMNGRLRGLEELQRRTTGPARARVFTVTPRVLIDNKASATHTVIEVNGRDRPGLLYDVGSVLSDLDLQISSAKIATYGERAVDVFYVKNLFGLKVEHDTKLAEMRERLMAALAEPAPAEHRTAAE